MLIVSFGVILLGIILTSSDGQILHLLELGSRGFISHLFVWRGCWRLLEEFGAMMSGYDKDTKGTCHGYGMDTEFTHKK